jgi:hypothetical protein
LKGDYEVYVYDKREDFPFETRTVQFSDLSRNIPRSTKFGVYQSQSQIIRHFRICSEFDGFSA